jgi:hypothetical protein
MTSKQVSWRGNLLGAAQDAKTAKGSKKGYLTAILYLAPATLGGGKNLCPYASPGCLASCLYTAGRGIMSNVQKSRLAKTQRYLNEREAFMSDLVSDLRRFLAFSARHDMVPAVRLNGTSDIMWERVPVVVNGVRFANIMEAFPVIQFYDYTKIPARFRRNLPANYDLTFSRAENNEGEAVKALEAGQRSAVVFSSDKLPTTWNGFVVVDADDTDLRFKDPQGVVVGLYAKGAAKRDKTGFVVQVELSHAA